MSATTFDDRARYQANPSMLTALKNPRMLTREVLAGLVVGLALIPEAIAFSVIAPFALGVAVVGLLESLLTAKLVDEITDTHSRGSAGRAC